MRRPQQRGESNCNSSAGFTLIELLVSITIIGSLALILVPFSMQMLIRNDLTTATSLIVHTAHRAQLLSQAGANDTIWGVSVQSGSVTLFKGLSYASRDTSNDELSPFSSAITPSGITELTFSKLIGNPSLTGTLTLTSQNNETATITIQSKGVLAY